VSGDGTLGVGGSLKIANGKALSVNGKLIVGASWNQEGTDFDPPDGDASGSVTITDAKIEAKQADGVVLAGATGVVPLKNADILTLNDGGKIVVKAKSTNGAVNLIHITFRAGTFMADGEVVIKAITGGDQIVTGADEGNGLYLGAADTALGLLTQGEAATYTAVKVDEAITFGNGANAVTVGSMSNEKASSLTASAKANIKLGTDANAADAINLGKTATLVLTVDAKIGAFAEKTKNIAIGDATNGKIGTAEFSGADTSLTNDGGTLTAERESGTENPTLTGADAGNSVITVVSAFTEAED
jgi:hypothetical protein